MFEKSTVLIIGAGASAEVGMPLGAGLKERVASDLRFRFETFQQISGNSDLLDLLKRRYGKDINTYTRAANELANVMSTFISIDEALHYFSNRNEIIELGKLAIVYEILSSERKSALRYEAQLGRPDLKRADETWLAHFLSMAIASLRKDEIKRAFENIVVINFNYDRTLEAYLYWALQIGAGLTPEEAIELVNNLDMIRPYGRVGPLDWQQRSAIKFGGPDHWSDVIFEWSKGIRTYTEQHSGDLPEEVDRALNASEVVIILGFGFHGQNMQLLKPISKRKANGERRKVFATKKGIDNENHGVLMGELAHCFNTTEIKLLDKTGAALLADLRPSIVLATS